MIIIILMLKIALMIREKKKTVMKIIMVTP